MLEKVAGIPGLFSKQRKKAYESGRDRARLHQCDKDNDAIIATLKRENRKFSPAELETYLTNANQSFVLSSSLKKRPLFIGRSSYDRGYSDYREKAKKTRINGMAPQGNLPAGITFIAN